MAFLRASLVAALVASAIATPLAPSFREASTLTKRGYSIKKGGSEGGKPWKDGKIGWCLQNESDVDDKEAFDIIEKGIKIWKDALDDKAKVEFKKKDKDDGKCNDDEEDDDQLLWIIFNKDGEVQTTVGFHDEGRNELKFDKNMSPENVEVDMAHELGHAIGLLHEHQRPDAGKSIKFNCENLEDYDEVKGEGHNMDELCKDHKKAVEAQFLGADFMVIEGDYEKDDEFDFKSIMLYDSAAGAKEDGKFVLTKTDGSEIKQNDKPSDKDVERVAKLYGDD